MKIYRAVRTNLQSQGFGASATSPSLLPLYQSMGLLGHNGYDFVTKLDELVYFDCDIQGQVLNTEIDGRGGLGVNIITNDSDGIFKHRYWHLKEFKCVAGQILDSGDLIGVADTTGWSTGNHLHRDLKPVKIDNNGNYIKEQPNNGYAGCVDLKPYYTNIFIIDHINFLKEQISLLQKIIELIKKILSIRIEIKSS